MLEEIRWGIYLGSFVRASLWGSIPSKHVGYCVRRKMTVIDHQGRIPLKNSSHSPALETGEKSASVFAVDLRLLTLVLSSEHV